MKNQHQILKQIRKPVPRPTQVIDDRRDKLRERIIFTELEEYVTNPDDMKSEQVMYIGRRK